MQYDGPSFSNIIIETLYDSSITILSQPDVLAPGGITVIQAEVQNNGNGQHPFILISLIHHQHGHTMYD